MAPTDSGDDYAVTDAVYGRDGLRSVADNAARNAITEDRRREGMLVFTQDAKKYWKLLASPWLGTDSDWTEFKVGLPEFKNAAIPNAPTVLDEIPVLSYRGAFWYLTFYKGSSTYSFIVSTANDGATAVNFNRTAQVPHPGQRCFRPRNKCCRECGQHAVDSDACIHRLGCGRPTYGHLALIISSTEEASCPKKSSPPVVPSSS